MAHAAGIAIVNCRRGVVRALEVEFSRGVQGFVVDRSRRSNKPFIPSIQKPGTGKGTGIGSPPKKGESYG